MQIQHVTTSAAPPAAGPYSHATSAGGFVFVSGTLGRRPGDSSIPEAYRDEVRQALANLVAVLQSAGASTDQVVQTTCMVTNVDQLSVFNAEYAKVFGSSKPSRSTFVVVLPGGVRVEIGATAFVGPGRSGAVE
jgi:2-iminobutanoate/2-iminopropanoate deaminase